MEPAAELRLLGGFLLRSAGADVQLPGPAQRVVAFLALHDRPVQRHHVAASLWCDTTDERAAGCLRTSLWRGHPHIKLVQATSTHLSLTTNVWVDVRALMSLSHGLFDPPTAFDPLSVDIDAISGELLPDLDDQWLLFERERLRLVSCQVLERLSELFMVAGNLQRAILAALSAVEADPLRESANRWLVRAHLAAGNRADALRAYERYRVLLDRELQLTPGERFADLLPTPRRVTLVTRPRR